MVDHIELDWNDDDADAYVERLKAQGHDGIIFDGIVACTEYVVFNPGQIRIVDVMRPKDMQRVAEPVREAEEVMSLSM